jgi:hypothetical protein
MTYTASLPHGVTLTSHLDREDGLCTVRFSDGAETRATVHPNDAHLRNICGFQSVQDAKRAHEGLHALLPVIRGEKYSAVLWCDAHHLPQHEVLAAWEEAQVIACTFLLAFPGYRDYGTLRLESEGCDLKALRSELLDVLYPTRSGLVRPSPHSGWVRTPSAEISRWWRRVSSQ